MFCLTALDIYVLDPEPAVEQNMFDLFSINSVACKFKKNLGISFLYFGVFLELYLP